MTRDHLDHLESKSIYMIREAYNKFKNLAVLWSIGKDSTTLVWLCKKAFFGELPFPVMHLDTGHKFPEMYEFRDKMVKEWGLNLIVSSNEAAIKRGVICSPGNTWECATELKTQALKMAIDEHGFDALLLAIRRDEHGVRGKERFFSPRDKDFRWDYENQPAEVWDLYVTEAEEGGHMRVHPLLHWTELDVWQYIRREGIPINSLYFAKGGKRYRSLGCATSTFPVESNASNVDEIVTELEHTKVPERAGRSLDKETTYAMQKLRALGYM